MNAKRVNQSPFVQSLVASSPREADPVEPFGRPVWPLRHVVAYSFPDAAVPGKETQQVLDGIKSAHEGTIDLRTTTLAAGSLDYLRLRAAFGIRQLPALVISKPWWGWATDGPATPVAMPPYCVVEDPRVFQDPQRMRSELEALILVFAAAKSTEIETALRTRRFRMLVWNAAAHLDQGIGYIAGITVRFVVGSTSVVLRFDARGWSVEEDDRPNRASASDTTAEAISEMINEGGPVRALAGTAR